MQSDVRRSLNSELLNPMPFNDMSLIFDMPIRKFLPYGKDPSRSLESVVVHGITAGGGVVGFKHTCRQNSMVGACFA